MYHHLIFFVVTTEQPTNFSLFLKTINKGLDLVDMQLRLGHLEYESEKIEEYLVLVCLIALI